MKTVNMRMLLSLHGLCLLMFWSGATQAGVTPGAQAPGFTLPDMEGHKVSLAQFKGKYVVLEWTNPECGFVGKHYGGGSMQNLQRTYTAQGVVWLTINSSAPGFEGYVTAREAKLVAAGQGGAATDVLLDHDGTVGHLYAAKTTPHMFIIGRDGKILYMGGIDSIPSDHIDDLPKAKNYVAAALNELLAGKPVTVKAAVPYGCSVKYTAAD
jgi:AhpC/TSA family